MSRVPPLAVLPSFKVVEYIMVVDISCWDSALAR